MLTERQKTLLKLIVLEYIKTAKAIPSNSLSEMLNVSSATIRSEMANLEEMGLLEKTHISSGRIPSENGYKYYVENIMEAKKITGEDMLKLQTIFSNNQLDINEAVKRSVEIVCDMTNYTSILLGDNSSEHKISKIDFVPIGLNHFIVIVVTDKGHVESKNSTVPEGVDSKELKHTIELINKIIIGTPLNEVAMKMEYEIKPVLVNYVKKHDELYSAFFKAFNDMCFTDDVYEIKKASNIIKAPEFDSPEKIIKLLDRFEDKDLIKKLEEDTESNIYIGSESGISNEVGMIKTKYDINGQKGTIAIVGPKRMEYDRVTSLLKYIKDNLGGKNE